jgi:hypothetical protein
VTKPPDNYNPKSERSHDGQPCASATYSTDHGQHLMSPRMIRRPARAQLPDSPSKVSHFLKALYFLE